MATTRPARSDPHLPPEEAARVEAKVRGYFDSVAPRRPAKPPRSDPSEDAAAAEAGAAGGDLPELRKLRDLAAEPQKLVLGGAGDVDGGEEYVETRYYDGLNCIDKQHHTTGTGFIKVDRPNDSSLNVATANYSFVNVRCMSNPATNDWIPSSETIIHVSNKPSRSDS